MHKFSEFTLVLSVVVVFVVVLGLVFNFQSIDREINRWKLLAQTSSDTAEIYNSLSKVEEGLVRWGMTEGYSGIFKTQENDMSLKVTQLQLIKTKAERLSMTPSNTSEYNTNLNLLQEDLKTLDLKTKSYWNVHVGLGWWLVGAFFLYTGLAALAFWNKDHSSFKQ